ncbi:MAG: hypothetical protein WDA60_19380, partial [Acidimicrobiia bacterium]
MTSDAGFAVRVRPVATTGDRVRMAADVQSPGLGEQELWYETDTSRADWLTDRADPFVVATLLLAMAEERDLTVTGAPVDPVLLRNLAEFQRIWHAWFGYPMVEVHAEVGTAGLPAAENVLAFSGGADAAFSAWFHTRGDAQASRPVQAAMMIFGIDIPVTEPDGFARASARSRRIVDSRGLEFVTVATNAWELPVSVPHFTGMGVAAALHTLGGRFGAGLIPSTAAYEDLVVPLNTSPVSDWLLGASRFEIVHSGALFNRFEKLRVLTDWPEAMANLRVCLLDPRRDHNCGKCNKCMLTLAAFRIVGVEPACFDRPVTDEELLRWSRNLPSARYY